MFILYSLTVSLKEPRSIASYYPLTTVRYYFCWVSELVSSSLLHRLADTQESSHLSLYCWILPGDCYFTIIIPFFSLVSSFEANHTCTRVSCLLALLVTISFLPAWAYQENWLNIECMRAVPLLHVLWSSWHSLKKQGKWAFLCWSHHPLNSRRRRWKKTSFIALCMMLSLLWLCSSVYYSLWQYEITTVCSAFSFFIFLRLHASAHKVDGIRKWQKNWSITL